MKELLIPIDFDELEEVISDVKKNVVIKWKNGDKLTLPRSEYSNKVRKHLLRQFAGDHIDKN